MNNVTTFQIKARAMLCTSLTVLLAACGGGSGGETTASGNQALNPAYLASVNANPKSNGYVALATTSTTTTTTTTPTTTTTTPTTTTTTPTTTTTSTYNYYVATTGSDSNPGTQAAPFLTIAKASQVAQPDTTIHVASGTYTGNFTTAANGTASAHVRYVSDVKWGAKIVGTGTEIAWTNNGNYIEVNGFDISTSGRLGFYSPGSFGVISDCVIHDIMLSGGASGNGGAAIDFTGSDWVVHHNIIRNIDAARVSGLAHVQGIYIAGANAYVYNNLVSGVAAYGIQQWHGATNSTIVNNTVFNTYGGILIGSGDAGTLPNGSQNNYIANNISANNLGYGIRELGLTSQNTYVSNIVYNNPTNTDITGAGDVVTGTLVANPMFVNYLANGAGDYHVQAASPAIDKGTSTHAPSTDLSYTARPRGAAIDIGVYEY